MYSGMSSPKIDLPCPLIGHRNCCVTAYLFFILLCVSVMPIESKIDVCYYTSMAAIPGLNYDRLSFEPYLIQNDRSVVDYHSIYNETRVNYADEAFIPTFHQELFVGFLGFSLLAFAFFSSFFFFLGISFLVTKLLFFMFPATMFRFRAKLSIYFAEVLFRLCIYMCLLSLCRYRAYRTRGDLERVKWLCRHNDINIAFEFLDDYFRNGSITYVYCPFVTDETVSDYWCLFWVFRRVLRSSLVELRMNLDYFILMRLRTIEPNPGPPEWNFRMPEFLTRMFETPAQRDLRGLPPLIPITTVFDDLPDLTPRGISPVPSFTYDSPLPSSPPRLVRQFAEPPINFDEDDFVDLEDLLAPSPDIPGFECGLVYTPEPFAEGVEFRHYYEVQFHCSHYLSVQETEVVRNFITGGFETFNCVVLPYEFENAMLECEEIKSDRGWFRDPFWPTRSMLWQEVPFIVLDYEDWDHPLHAFWDLLSEEIRPDDRGAFIAYRLMTVEKNPGPSLHMCFEFEWNYMLGEEMFVSNIFAWQSINIPREPLLFDEMYAMSHVRWVDLDSNPHYSEYMSAMQPVVRVVTDEFHTLPPCAFGETIISRLTYGVLAGFIRYRLLSIETNPGPTWSEVLQNPAPTYVRAPIEPVDIVYHTLTRKDFEKKCSFKYLSKLRSRIKKMEKSGPSETKRLMRQCAKVCEEMLRGVYADQMDSLNFIKNALAPRIDLNHGAALESGINNMAKAVSDLKTGVPFIHTVPFIDRAFDSFNAFVTDDSVLPAVIFFLVVLFSWYSSQNRENALSPVLCSIMIAYCAYKYGATDKMTLACIAVSGYYRISLTNYWDKKEDDDDDGYVSQAFTWDDTMHETLLLTIMGAVFSMIYGRHTTDSSMLPFLKELGDLAKIEKGVKMSFDYFLKIMSRFSSWCASTFDTEGFLVVEGQLPAVDAIVREVLDLVKEFQDPELLFNQTNGLRLLDLQNRLDKMANIELKSGSAFNEARKILFNMSNKLKPLIQKFDSLGRAKDSTRQVPVVYCFIGPPGVGKTFAIKQIMEYVLAMTLPAHREKNFLLSPGNEIWYVSPDTNFDGDGYNYQWGFGIDEFLAATETEGGTDTNLVRAFLQWISDHPKRLNRAEITEKDATYFNCRVGVLTTNVFPWKDLQSIRNLEALKRRCKAFYVVPRKENCKVGTYTDNIETRRLDESTLPEYVFGEEPVSHLEFHPCDVLPLNEQSKITGGCFSIHEIMKMMVKDVEAKQVEYEKSLDLRKVCRYAAFKEKYEKLGQPLPDYLREQAGSLFEKILGSFVPVEEEKDTGYVGELEVTPDTIEETSPIMLDPVTCCPIFPVRFKQETAEVEFKQELDSFADWAKWSAAKWWDKPENKRLVAFVAMVGSASLLWYFTRSQFKEQSGEARMKHKPKAKPKPFRSANLRYKDQAGEYGNNLMALVFSVYRRNIVVFGNQVGDSLGHVLMIRGRVGVMPKHYLPVIQRCLKENPDMIVNIQPYTRNICPEIYLRDIELAPDPTCDRMMIRFPPIMPEFHDITPFFAVRSDDFFEKWNFKAGLVTDNHFFKADTSGVFYHPVEATARGPAFNEKQECYGDGFHFNGGTFEGMCGLPYIAMIKNRPQIFAMHVAGGTRRPTCFGTALFRDVVEDMVKDEKFSSVLEVCEPNELHDQCSLPDQFLALGVAPYVSQPTTNAHVPSVLMDAWGPHKMENTLLYDVEIDGELIRPRLRAMLPYCKNQKAVNYQLARAVMESYWSRVVNRSVSPELKRQVSYVEAVVGIECQTKGVSMSSSMGFPWASDHVSKEDVWGPRNEPKDLSRPLAKVVEEKTMAMYSQMEKRVKPFVPFTDNIKSEKMLKEKVKIKSRIFTYPPVEFLIICKMMLDGFCKWCEVNMIKNGLTIGINPYSVDWHILANTLLSVGDNMIDGDFKAYDGSLMCVWFYLYFEMVKRFYRSVYTDAQMNVLDMICEVLVSSVHIYPEGAQCIFYEWFGAMSSGVLCTGNGNSMIGQMVIRYAMVDILLIPEGGAQAYRLSTKFDFEEFESNFELVTNGDDNVLSVSAMYAEVINQMNLMKALSFIGMTYTDAQKSGVLVAHRSICLVQFLKRGFVYNIEWCRWIAPLELAPILEAPYWKTRSGTFQNLAGCVEQSLGDLSLYGKQVYEPISVLIIDACIERDVPIPTRTDWESVFGFTLHRESQY